MEYWPLTVRLALLTLGCLASACSESPHSGQSAPPAVARAPASSPAGGSGKTISPRAGGLPKQALFAPGADPTAPTAVTGVRQPLSAVYDSELAALLTYQRSMQPLSCPGLFQAGSCGDGTCDGLAETSDSCPPDCVFHQVGAYNDLPVCPSYQLLVRPTTVAEVQEAVRQAVRAGRRVRPVGKRHSASAAICGDGVALDMTGLNDVKHTRIEGDVAYVQPGVTMIELGDYLAVQGLSIGFTHLGFRGVTVAGAIGTSAHGSSPVFNNALSQRLRSLKVVLADGSLASFNAVDTPPTLWRTLQTSLGLLGVIVEVGVLVEPAFQLEVDVSEHDDSELLSASSPLSLLSGCDWGQFNWFPHHRKFLRWCGHKTQAAAQAGANNVLLDPGVSPDFAQLAKTAFHAGTCDDGLNALLEQARVDGLSDSPPLVITGSSGAQEHVTHAIGPAHRMTSADLIEIGGNKYFQMDWEVAIPQQYMADALHAARKVFDAHDVSLPGVGVFVRFGKIEQGGWLSYHSAGKDFAEGQTAMFFESPVAVPAGYSKAELADYLHIYQELIGLFVRHLGARAHWGKNLDPIFDLQRSVGTFDGRIDKVNEAIAQLDPYGVFANDFARRIGVHWPQEGADFGQALGQSPCSCGIEAAPQCAYRDKLVYANGCRASCAGKAATDLVAGPCQAFVWGVCSALDTRTCVWEQKAREQNPFVDPVIRY